MNNSTTSTLNSTISWEQKSLNDLIVQLPLNILLTVVGFLTTVSNFGVFICVHKGGDLFKSHYYKLILHLTSVTGFGALLVFVYAGLIRVIDAVCGIPVNTTVMTCGLMLLPNEILFTVDSHNLLILAFDRTLAVAFPFHYKNMNLSKKYKIGFIAIPWITGCVEAAIKYMLWTPGFGQTKLSLCVMANTRTPTYMSYKAYKNIFVTVATLLFYVAAIVTVKWKIIKNSSNAKQLKKDLGFKLMVISDALTHTCTDVLSQIYVSVVVLYVSPQARIMLSPIALLLVLLATTPRFIEFYLFNKDFKRVVKRHLFCFNHVSDISSVPVRGT